MIPCPPEDDLVRFVDGSLSLEATSRLDAHVARCGHCRERDRALRSLIADLKAPILTSVDLPAHVRAVMDRLDRPLGVNARPRRAWMWAAPASACAAFAALYLGFRTPAPADAWQARGGATESTIARDVGVQPYAVQGRLRPLASGVTIDGDTPLTAGFRNLGRGPAYLLLFAVDAHRTVHWISPAYTRLEDDPPSTPLPVSVQERTLDTTAVLADVAPGPLRIVAVITATPARVSDVESLGDVELNTPRLVRRLPGADVRETVVEVRENGGGTR